MTRCAGQLESDRERGQVLNKLAGAARDALVHRTYPWRSSRDILLLVFIRTDHTGVTLSFCSRLIHGSTSDLLLILIYST